MRLTVAAAAPKGIRAACLAAVAAVTGGKLLFGKRLSLVQFAGSGGIICGCALVLAIFQPNEPYIQG